MKKIFVLFLSLISIILLVSCSKSKPYRDDLPCSELSQVICDEAEVNGGYSLYDNDYIAFLFEDTSLFDECSVIYSTDVTDINEAGVFHCQDKDSAKMFTESVSKYISEMQTNERAFIESYAPRQMPKLENAEVRQYGNYVIYLIMNDENKEDALKEIEKMLKK